MKPKSIGIIGGAGPMAGAYLLERIFSIACKKYHCHKDSDFPQLHLLSFPFSEMLSPKMDEEQLQAELKSCLRQLRSQGASVIAIACNTLHAFLDEQDLRDDFLHLPKTLGKYLSHETPPLVLCTSTSVQFGLHRRYFPCVYPDPSTQVQIDEIIDQILKEGKTLGVLQKLKELIQAQMPSTIILGCTELSLFYADIQEIGKHIVDPLEVVAHEILQKSFSKSKE